MLLQPSKGKYVQRERVRTLKKQREWEISLQNGALQALHEKRERKQYFYFANTRTAFATKHIFLCRPTNARSTMLLLGKTVMWVKHLFVILCRSFAAGNAVLYSHLYKFRMLVCQIHSCVPLNKDITFFLLEMLSMLQNVISKKS